jgi:hypothetical protein
MPCIANATAKQRNNKRLLLGALDPTTLLVGDFAEVGEEVEAAMMALYRRTQRGVCVLSVQSFMCCREIEREPGGAA